MEHDSAVLIPKLGGMDGGTAAALYAQRELLEADAIAHTDEFQLDPPFKLSNSRAKESSSCECTTRLVALCLPLISVPLFLLAIPFPQTCNYGECFFRKRAGQRTCAKAPRIEEIACAEKGKLTVYGTPASPLLLLASAGLVIVTGNSKRSNTVLHRQLLTGQQTCGLDILCGVPRELCRED